MLRRLSALYGFTIQGLDGDVGCIADVYFDDRTWVTRYLVVDTAYWLEGRKALISPFAVSGIDWYHSRVLVELTRSHVESSPEIDIELPDVRRQETDYLDYYGYPYYWTGSQSWGSWPSPSTRAPGSRRIAPVRVARGKKHVQWPDARLRSVSEVSGYQIGAADGLIGQVADLVQDELTWTLRYLIVDAHSWLPGRQVLVSTQWVEAVSWDLGAVFVGVDREAIRSSPAWQADDLLAPDHERALFEHYEGERSHPPSGRDQSR